jgi:uncharacterized protein (TIGR02265 family)
MPPKQRFQEPIWSAPLDVEAELRAIPEHAQVRGFMTAPMVAEAKRRRMTWQAPRDRYVPFTLYPLREHVRILIDYGNELFPKYSMRQVLRKLGRAAPDALLDSTLGKVTLGAAQGVRDIVAAFAKAYELSLQPGRAYITEEGQRQLVVKLDGVYYFLDSHHVGAFEGALKRAGVRGRVLTAPLGEGSAELLLTW